MTRARYDDQAEGREEYGLMLDCVEEGCVPRHADHGNIYDVGPTPPTEFTVNGHAASVVRRTVSTSMWGVVGRNIDSEKGTY